MDYLTHLLSIVIVMMGLLMIVELL